MLDRQIERKLDSIIEKLNRVQGLIYFIIEDTLCLISDIVEKVQKEKDKIPYQINVISSAVCGKNLRETAHSRILVDLLRNKEIRSSFIKFFFEKFNLDISDSDYIPPPDTNRIDATIKGKDYYIIIENKINDAPEQCGQIYRYVQIAREEYDINQIYVLYLNRDTNIPPTVYSLSKDGTGIVLIDKVLNERLICHSYKHSIIKWLKSINNKKDFLVNQPYLQSAIVQYLDYLENIFQTTNIYKPMNAEIEKLLIQKLELDSLSNCSERVSKINEQIENTEFLIEKLQMLKESEVWKLWNTLFKEQYGLKLHIEENAYNGKNIGFDFLYKKSRMRCCIQEEDNVPYWGIFQYDGNAKLSTVKFFNSLIQQHSDLMCINNNKLQDNWPIWNWTNLDNGFFDFSKLADIIIKESKRENSEIIFITD